MPKQKELLTTKSVILIIAIVAFVFVVFVIQAQQASVKGNNDACHTVNSINIQYNQPIKDCYK